jgi:dipeptidyl aminopeptidase/acylaminoacyl peptidase
MMSITRCPLGFCALLVTVSPSLADEQYGVPRTIVTVEKQKGFILRPEKPAADGTRPWVWYAPTFIDKHPNKSNEWLFRRLLDSGYAICGVEVGESYGSPAGRKVFSAFYDLMIKDYKLDAKPYLVAQSRGGLMHYNWASENPDKVRAIVGIYPVCDLRSYPGLEKVAPAYGMTAKELEAKLKDHNPIDRLEPLAKAKVPILHIHGDADNVVLLDANSQVVAERYKAFGGPVELIVIPGKGHAEVKEFFQSERVLEFLKRGK